MYGIRDLDELQLTRLALNILSYPPIYDLIFFHLSPAALIRVSRTCRTGQSAIRAFSNRAFNINKHLSRFFSDPLAFRSLQATTATLISGSSALQFLDRTFYPESDLDVYVHGGFARQIGRWLMDKEGYEYKPYPSQHKDFEKQDEVVLEEMRVNHLGPGVRPAREDLNRFQQRLYRMQGVASVFHFEKAVVNNSDEETENQLPLKVQIIVSEQSPLQCILGFHSTCVMNFITYDAAYSLYPFATFEKRRAVSIGAHKGEHDVAALYKYMRRGWKFPVSRHSIPPYFLQNSVRKVDDSHSWIIPLSRNGVEPPDPLSLTSDALTWDPVIYNSWKLERENMDSNLYMRYSLASPTLMRFKYLIAEPEFFTMVLRFCRTQGGLSHMKGWGASGEGPHDLVGTEYWTWWDSEMPAIYASHLEEKQEEILQQQKELQRRKRSTQQSVDSVYSGSESEVI